MASISSLGVGSNLDLSTLLSQLQTAESQPLVALQALADLGIGIPYFIASAIGAGSGNVRAVTYEYGNAYIIVAGLMNLLVVVDVYDIALGRK